MIILFFTIETACRLGFTVMLQELFTKVADIEGVNNKRDAYIYAVFCGVVWFIGLFSFHNGFYESQIFFNRMRSQLVLLVYTKLSKISQYTVKNQELGKIINLLSNDFNSV